VGQTMTEKPNQKYRVVRDDHGYACAIAEGDQWILHLNPGTEFNEKNAGQIVDELNQRQDFIDHIRWTQNLWRHGIEIMRKNNLVIASDTPMEKLAFTFYSDLCEIDSRAQHLFAEGPGDEDYKDQSAIRAQGIVPYPRPYEEAIVQTERDRILDILIPLLPEKQFARLDGELGTLRLKEFAEGLRSIPPVPSNKVETEKKDGD